MGYICRRHRVRLRAAGETPRAGRSPVAAALLYTLLLRQERERKARLGHDDSNGFAGDEVRAPSWIS
jgi:hypothetical protein